MFAYNFHHFLTNCNIRSYMYDITVAWTEEISFLIKEI